MNVGGEGGAGEEEEEVSGGGGGGVEEDGRDLNLCPDYATQLVGHKKKPALRTDGSTDRETDRPTNMVTCIQRVARSKPVNEGQRWREKNEKNAEKSRSRNCRAKRKKTWIQANKGKRGQKEAQIGE